MIAALRRWTARGSDSRITKERFSFYLEKCHQDCDFSLTYPHLNFMFTCLERIPNHGK